MEKNNQRGLSTPILMVTAFFAGAFLGMAVITLTGKDDTDQMVPEAGEVVSTHYSVDLTGTVVSIDEDSMELETQTGTFILPVPAFARLYIQASGSSDAPVPLYDREMAVGNQAVVNLVSGNGITEVGTISITTY